MYAIIDVETTGGYKEGHKITEIAIILFDGNEIVDRFSSLINPERNIPYTITRLTGITNEMVSAAPKFYEVAKKIIEMTEGATFVAHNVFFDYRFIQREFQELGYTYKRPKICTVRMGRKAFPGLKSYSLGRLCQDLGIEIKARHRAMGDCEATAKLFRLILEKNTGWLVPSIEEEKNKMPLPSHLDRKSVENLPESAGVYYFYNQLGELLYIGKSKNIRKRVLSHFRVDVKNRRDLELKSQVASVDFKKMGNELASLLFESDEIKKLRPRYNRQLRFKNFSKGLRLNQGLSGLLEIQIFSKKQHDDGLYFFSNRKRAEGFKNSLYRMIYGIDEDSLDFERKRELMIKTLGIEKHNELLRKVFYSKTTPKEDYILELPGRKVNELCLIEVKERMATRITFQSKNEDQSEVVKLSPSEDSKIILYNFFKKA